MKTVYLFIFVLFLFGKSFSQENDNEGFILIETINIQTEKFDFKIKSEKNSFQLIICNNSGKCSTEYNYLKAIEPKDFLDSVIIQINSEFSHSYDDSTIIDGKSNDEKIKAIIKEIEVLDEQAIRKKLSEAENVIRTIETSEDQHSGELVLLNKVTHFNVVKPKKRIKAYFPHFYESYDEPKQSRKSANNSSNTNTGNRTNKMVTKYRLKQEYRRDFSEYELEILNATVVFFNNKASTISVNALLKPIVNNDNNANDIEKENVETLEFYNGNYSMPLRSFTYYQNPKPIIARAKYKLIATTKYGEQIEVHVNDIFDYKSFGTGTLGNFGFSIANQRYYLSNVSKEKSKVKIVQRRFFDFFTGVVHTDLLGLNDNSSNSTINAQASILKPMNLGNWGKVTALRQFRLTANIALDNSFENDNRFIDFEGDDGVNHFDLFKKQNLSTIFSLDVFSYEAKGWFTTWSLGYNLGFYRTGYQYTNVSIGEDEILSGQLISLTHGPYVSFEFRPQDNFGADIVVSLDELNLNDDDVINDRSFTNDILENQKSSTFFLNHNIVNVSASFYWLTSPGKSDGGVYAKVAAGYHTPTSTAFPQIMVGYATNLTSFVNRFKPKKPTDLEEMP